MVIFLVILAIGFLVLIGNKGGKGLVQGFLIDREIEAIERSLSQTQKMDVTLLGYSTENAMSTVYRSHDNLLVKIMATYLGELGKKEVTYYFDDSFVIYISEKTSDYDKPFGEVIKTKTDRFYFEKDKLIIWIPKRQSEKVDDSFKEEELDQEWERLLIGIGPRLKWTQTEIVPLASFLPGKSFIYSCEAGEKGVFGQDGKLTVSILGESSTTTALWRVDGEKLIISGSVLADGIYEDLVFEVHENYEAKYGGYTVAHKKCFTIGSEVAIIDEFNRASWYDLQVQ